jgi:hypothetical protein
MSHNLWKVIVSNNKKNDDFVIESHYEILPEDERLRKKIKGIYYIKNGWGGCDGYCLAFECWNCKSDIMDNAEEPYGFCNVCDKVLCMFCGNLCNKCGGLRMMDALAR